MSESPLFNAVSTSIVSEASTLLKPVLYGPDELVVCAGDVCKQMYFVSDGAMLRETCRGRVNVINRSNLKHVNFSMRKMIKATERLCFGDGNVVFQRASQRETIITLTFSNLLTLTRDDMMQIWYRNPLDWEDAKSALARCLWKEILTSGAFTSSAGLRTTSSWRSLSRSPGRNAFRVISKSGSPHNHRASRIFGAHEKRRRSSSVRRPKSFRKRFQTSPPQSEIDFFVGDGKRYSSPSPTKSLSPRSPSRRRDINLLNQKCDRILQALSRLDKRITNLEFERPGNAPPPPPL